MTTRHAPPPSPRARHSSGDIAAYLRTRHGVIRDTANHHEDLGLTRDEKRWKGPSKAAAEIADPSVFRSLTNFVREKRING